MLKLLVTSDADRTIETKKLQYWSCYSASEPTITNVEFFKATDRASEGRPA